MEDFITGLINQQIRKLNAEKERVIKERLAPYVDKDFTFETEVRRNFPRLKIVKHIEKPQSEFYYWNDGSENGVLIVEFYYDEYTFNPAKGGIILTLKWR